MIFLVPLNEFFIFFVLAYFLVKRRLTCIHLKSLKSWILVEELFVAIRFRAGVVQVEGDIVATPLSHLSLPRFHKHSFRGMLIKGPLNPWDVYTEHVYWCYYMIDSRYTQRQKKRFLCYSPCSQKSTFAAKGVFYHFTT